MSTTTQPASSTYLPVRDDWLARRTETILEPDLPIVDPHHHLWERPGWVYMLDDLLADTNAGHNIVATVFVQCRAFHRAEGLEAMKPVGETEFVNGVAAMSASGQYGEARVCAGIVGHVDLRLGDVAREVLEAHIRAGGGRFRGIRQFAAWDPDPEVLGPLAPISVPGLYADPAFRAGFAHLAPLGLSFDAWLVEPQLGELVELARAFPDTPIVLNHIGTPLALGSYAGRLEERFPNWRASITELAKSPNVTVKLGGLSMPFLAFPNFMADPPASSSELAAQWRPYLEACIEAFGADRCMFESNFPVQKRWSSYQVTWNAFKRIAAGASAAEQAALFAATAARVYGVPLP